MTTDHENSQPPESSVDPTSIEGIFIGALARAAGNERSEFVSQACGEDAQRIARVNALLMAFEDSGSFLQQPAAQINPLDSFSQYFVASEKDGVIGQLGDYEILETIGRGGMGVVFRALDPKLNRVVAIKALAPELSANPNSRRRFLREAQSVASVVHPHIVTIHAVNDDTLPYFVMECIVGQSLQQKLDKCGALPLKEVLRIGQQISEGLSAAHRQGIIHRDVKPANILLENGIERVRLTDFGLARGRDDESITLAGEISGTPMYMSPEQSRGEAVDHRSDLFSLGAVLYAMCTGHSPFRGANMAAVVKNVCDREPQPVSEFNPDLPEWVDTLIGRLLGKDPERRPDSADSVGETLRLGLSGAVPELKPVPNRSPIASNLLAGIGPSVAGGADPLASEMTLQQAVQFQSEELKRLLACCIVILPIILMFVIANSGLTSYRTGRNDLSWLLVISLLLVPILGWFSFYVVKFEHGNEARWKGILAGLAALFLLPFFVIGVPVGAATLKLLTGRRAKSAFKAAGQGDYSQLQQMVPSPKGSFLWNCVGAAMTFAAPFWLASRNGRLSPEGIRNGGILAAGLLLLGVLVPLTGRMARRLDNRRMSFARRPIVASVVFALIAGVMVSPFLLPAPEKETAAIVSNTPVTLVTNAREQRVVFKNAPTSVVTVGELGGLIADIEPGLVVELHRNKLTWSFSSRGLISPHRLTEFMGRDENGDVLYMFGKVAAVRPSLFEPSDVFQLPVGKYDVVVFDSHVGWGRCNFFSTTGDESDELQIDPIGRNSILAEMSRDDGVFDNDGTLDDSEHDSNLLPAPYFSAWQIEDVEITTGSIGTLNVKRDFDRLSRAEPEYSDKELLTFKWGRKTWTLDRFQAKCVHELFKNHGNADGIAEDQLLELLETDADNIAKVFNDGKHPAFGGLVIEVEVSDDSADEKDKPKRFRLSDIKLKPDLDLDMGGGGGFGRQPAGRLNRS